MASQNLLTNIIINATMGSGFSKVMADLSQAFSTVQQITEPIAEFEEKSIKVYRNYEDSMASAEVALSTIYGKGTTELKGVMAVLDEYATEWAASSIFHTSDVGNAIAELARSGYDMTEIISGMPAAMELAQAGSLDLTQAVDMIVKAQREFGEEANIDVGNFIDMWAFAANSSATNIEEIGDAIMRMGNTVQFAADPAEILTFLATLANTGTTGAQAGTMLRNAMIRLIAPTEKASDAMADLGLTEEEWNEATGEVDSGELLKASETLKEMGFSVYDTNGELRPMSDIFFDLGTCLGQVAGGVDKIADNKDSLAILSAIFPTRTISGALPLIQKAQTQYDGLLEKLRGGGASGYGEYAAETMMDTVGGSIETFLSKVERLEQLAGSELAEPLRQLLGALGGAVDSISGLDQASFSALVTGLSTLAGLGTLSGVAAAVAHLISAITSTPLTTAIVGLAALVAVMSGLAAYNDVKFEMDFGDMALDMTTLRENIDTMTTEGETALNTLDPFLARLSEQSNTYKEAMTNFSTTIRMAQLGKNGKLTSEDAKTLTEYGEQMVISLQEGIAAAHGRSRMFLSTLLRGDELTEEQKETYSELTSASESLYSSLSEQATELGEGLSSLIADGLAKGMSPGEISAAAQTYIDNMNQIQAQIQAAQREQEYYAELSRAGRVSKDTIEEYLGELSTNREERLGEVNEEYDWQQGAARQAYEHELERKVSDQEWESTDRYALIEKGRQEAIAGIDAQIGEAAGKAFGMLMEDSDVGQQWNQLLAMAKEAGVDENGNIAWDKLDTGKWFASAAEASKFFTELSLRFSHKNGIWQFADLFDLTDTDMEKMLSGMEGTPQGDYLTGLMNDVMNWREKIEPSALSFLNPPTGAMGDSITELQSHEGVVLNYTVDGYTQDIEAKIHALDGGTLTQYLQADDSGITATISSFDGTEIETVTVTDPSELESTFEKYGDETIQVHLSGANIISDLNRDKIFNQDVKLRFGGQEELTETINGASGQEVMAQVNGNTGPLEMSIQDQNGQTLVENVTGDAGSLASVIDQYNGRVITVTIRANAGSFNVPTPSQKFASGGRAVSPSIFGEAGPEWAIPEEHSAETAELLRQAAEASGFAVKGISELSGQQQQTMPDLSGYSTVNNTSSNTLVYSPTINAQDTEGVDRALQDDKKRLDRWYREMRTREEMEVFA